MPDVLPPVQSNEDWQAAFGFATGRNGEIAEDSVRYNIFYALFLLSAHCKKLSLSLLPSIFFYDMHQIIKLQKALLTI